MATNIYLPTGLTFKLARVAAPALGVAVGDPNPFWDQLLELIAAGPLKRGSTDEALAVYGPIINTRWIDLTNVQAVVAAGGEVDGLPVFAQVDPAAEVPASLPGATYPEVDEAGEPTGVTLTHTWESWKPSTHEFHVRQEGTYVALVYREEYLKASEFVPLVAGGLTVLNMADFQALTPIAEEPAT
jgi:hypothetical protein